jgi:hypothetical protein
MGRRKRTQLCQMAFLGKEKTAASGFADSGF